MTRIDLHTRRRQRYPPDGTLSGKEYRNLRRQCGKFPTVEGYIKSNVRVVRRKKKKSIRLFNYDAIVAGV